MLDTVRMYINTKILIFIPPAVPLRIQHGSRLESP
jgi:hypothetical protein